MEKDPAELFEAMQGLGQGFMSMEELIKAGEQGTLPVKSLPFDYDFNFLQMYPEHPMAGGRFIRIKSADTVRDLSLNRKNPFSAEVLANLHRSLFDCCSTVRLSIAEALSFAGDKSSIDYLERLAKEENHSEMVKNQVEGALQKLSKLCGE
jgi:hypothetical protein